MNWRYALAVILLACSCESQDAYKKAEDAEDAGREFIRASLDGNYKKALFYLYKDSSAFNVRVLDKWKNAYEGLDKQEKSGFKSASIMPIEIAPESDSNSYTFTYYNSYKKDTTTIRILKISDEWLVDLRDLH